MRLDANYYKRLITSEYRHSEKFCAMVEKLIYYGLETDSAVDSMLVAFEVDTATTAQLDILGTIVGVSRQLSFEPSAAAVGELYVPVHQSFLAVKSIRLFIHQVQTKCQKHSFLSGFAPSDMTSGNLLDDDVYRLMIKAKIIQNSWKGTISELYELWSAVMGADKKIYIEDKQDMSYDVVLQGEYTKLEEELIVHAYIIPKPEGVRINILTFVSTEGLPLFAYDYNTMRYSGYGSHWAVTEIKENDNGQ